ncbi:MAG TPA: hypothetical protein VMU84_05310 [Thermoanaerobaculia bacterium]|nr:hypothetical protein [Thermoanaerobaculia bacterium]
MAPKKTAQQTGTKAKATGKRTTKKKPYDGVIIPGKAGNRE